MDTDTIGIKSENIIIHDEAIEAACREECNNCYSYCFPKLTNSFDNLIQSLIEFKNNLKPTQR